MGDTLAANWILCLRNNKSEGKYRQLALFFLVEVSLAGYQEHSLRGSWNRLCCLDVVVGLTLPSIMSLENFQKTHQLGYFDYWIPFPGDFGLLALHPIACPNFHLSKGLTGIPGVSHVLLYLNLSVVLEVAGLAESLLLSLPFLQVRSFQHRPRIHVRSHKRITFLLFQKVS